MKEKGKIDVFITILLIYIFFLLNSSFPQTFWKYNCNVNSLYCYCYFLETTNHIIHPTSLKTIRSVKMFWKTNFLLLFLVSCLKAYPMSQYLWYQFSETHSAFCNLITTTKTWKLFGQKSKGLWTTLLNILEGAFWWKWLRF